ncbi:MAG: FkbM family methyltransferase [Gammaproteobacteria bacterium]
MQSLLLAAYRACRGPRWLAHPLGRRVLVTTYAVYKRWVEAPRLRSLREYVLPGTWVVDVGANVGYHARLFAGWLDDDGRVLAIEPDQVNLEALRWYTRSCAGRVEVAPVAAAAFSGPAGLARSADSHADHRLVEAGKGEPITAARLDELLQAHGSPPVSLLKIDVQGAEYAVLAGALRMLDRSRPAILLEVDVHDTTAAVQAVRALELLHRLGYACHGEPGRAEPRAWQPLAILEHARQRGYGDYLFLPSPRSPGIAHAC